MAHAAVGLGKTFIDQVLAIPEDVDLSQCPPPRASKNPFTRLAKAQEKSKSEIAAEMTRVIRTYGLAPGLVAVECQNAPDSAIVDDLGQKVDSALFTEELAPDDDTPHWADQLVPIEYKRHHTRGDPFDDRKLELESDAQDRKKVQGQIISYVELIFAVQQRTVLIMILVMGRKFRLLHWDRSGVSVSLSIDYYDDWQTFCNVLWRISVLARFHPELLGINPSATRIFPDDPRWQQMDDAEVKCESDADHKPRDLAPDELTDETVTFAYVRKLFRTSLQASWPRYKLKVPDGKTVRKFLVCRPYFRAKGMTGRGTRGYVALDTQSKSPKFVWLKDAWRAHYALLHKEGDILRQLNDAGVSNIPTLVCHGDIREQTTKTPEFWELVHPREVVSIPTSPASSAGSSKRKRTDSESTSSSKPKGLTNDETDSREDSPLRRHIHYRIVVMEVCLDLPSFENGRQLVSIIKDSVKAHYQATQLHIIHRDVSSGNILILPRIVTYPDGCRCVEYTGILTDWELSKGLLDPRKPRQPERTGTWQYMSVALLDNPSKVVEIADDLEAHFYVLLYHAVRYLRSNCTNVPNWIEDFFDVFTIEDGQYKCGYKKDNAITKGELVIKSGTPLEFDSPMDALLYQLVQAFRAFYTVRTYDEEQKKKASLHLGASTTLKTPAHQPLLPPIKPESDGATSDEDLVLAQLPFDLLYWRKGKPAPTQQERVYAKIVSDPPTFLALLRRSVRTALWPSNDKEGDRVPADWVSTKPFGPTILPNNTSNKRQRRTAGPYTFANALNAESPTRRPSYPRKAKSDFPRLG